MYRPYEQRLEVVWSKERTERERQAACWSFPLTYRCGLYYSGSCCRPAFADLPRRRRNMPGEKFHPKWNFSWRQMDFFAVVNRCIQRPRVSTSGSAGLAACRKAILHSKKRICRRLHRSACLPRLQPMQLRCLAEHMQLPWASKLRFFRLYLRGGGDCYGHGP